MVVYKPFIKRQRLFILAIIIEKDLSESRIIKLFDDNDFLSVIFIIELNFK